MTSGLVFNIQRFSIGDEPGIRTTVFLKGCPASCWWCHNPESQASQPEILVLESRCQSCGTCIEACPHGYLVADDEERQRLGLTCKLCGTCVEVCPSGARLMAGTDMDATTLVREVLADRIFFDDSGGGVTFSGGEPLAQFDFLRALLEACRTEELHTVVDTSGYAPREYLLAIAPLTDLFLYDLKLVDNDRHQEVTGVSNRPILANLAALGEVHRDIWIRVPVIPGVNDDIDNMKATAAIAATTPGVQRVELLPYHRNGMQKFDRLGKSYRLTELETPSKEQVETLAEPFRRQGLDTRIRS